MGEEENNIPQMRETIERLSKEKAGLEKTVAEQATSLRVIEAKDAFRDAGYNPNNGSLYAAMSPDGDITAEAVTTFATEQGLVPVEASTQESTEEAGSSTSVAPEESAKLAAMSGSSSRAGEGGAGGASPEALTRDEWKQLYVTDPTAAKQAIASGQVEISSGEPAPRGTNPYVKLAPA